MVSVVADESMRMARIADSNSASVLEEIGTYSLDTPCSILYCKMELFNIFIYVHVISLTDEIPEHRKEAEEIWAKVGDQFMLENESDLKDKIDYLQETLDHYPANSM